MVQKNTEVIGKHELPRTKFGAVDEPHVEGSRDRYVCLTQSWGESLLMKFLQASERRLSDGGEQAAAREGSSGRLLAQGIERGSLVSLERLPKGKLKPPPAADKRGLALGTPSPREMHVHAARGDAGTALQCSLGTMRQNVRIFATHSLRWPQINAIARDTEGFSFLLGHTMLLNFMRTSLSELQFLFAFLRGFNQENKG